MKKLLILLCVFTFSCNQSEIKEQTPTDSSIVIVDTLINVDLPKDSVINIDSLNEARKKSRDSIRNLNSGK